MGDLLTLIVAATLLAGVALCLRGLIGRRTSGAPCCARCGYDLSSFIPDHCPECGAPMGSGSIRTRRRRSTRSAVVGALLALLAGGVLYTRWAPITGQPAAVLACTALAGVHRPGTLSELADRVEKGTCPGYVVRLLLSKALREQARVDTIENGWTRLVAAAFKAGQLTSQQSERFMHGALPQFTVQLRAEGSPPYWALDFAQLTDQATPRFAWNDLVCTIDAQVLVDGKVAGPWTPLDFTNATSARWTCGGLSGNGGWMILGLRATQPPPGSTVTLLLRSTLTDGWTKSVSPMRVIRTEEHSLKIPASFTSR
jgi:hypothetical protein